MVKQLVINLRTPFGSAARSTFVELASNLRTPFGSAARSTFVALTLVTMLLGACGGGKKEETTPEGGGLPERDYENQPKNDDNMISMDKAAEIQNLLQRKERIMSRCLADAVDAKELPKNARGKITLDIVVGTDGSSDVKVINKTLESGKLEECVIGHVKSIVFPQIRVPYPTSYTYGFEAI